MRTTFKVSMAAAGALLATVAVPMSAEQSASVRAERPTQVERQLFAAGANSVRRPILGVTDELDHKSA